MSKFEVQVQEYQELRIYGVKRMSNDKTVAKDIPQLSRLYHQKTGTEEGAVLPFFVLSENYREDTRDFALFVGGLAEHATLDCLVLPAGQYARLTVKPKFGFGWGLAVGEAKRWFYTKWLPSSGWRALNLEYEHHTGQSVGKAPAIDVIFAVERPE